MKALDDFVEGVSDAAKSADPWILTDEVIPGKYKHLNLIEIPAIMQKTGRPMGAKMMNFWFSKPAYTMTEDVKAGRTYTPIPQGVVETNAVTMKWLLQFTRAASAYNELKDVISGINKSGLLASKEELFSRLSRHSKFSTVPTTFGDSTLNMVDVHQQLRINFRGISTTLKDQILDPTDDLYCALGAFSIYLIAAGKVKPVKSVRTTHEITVEKFGIYMRDTYDFNGPQPLGFWNREGVSKTPALGLSAIDNGSFREWRLKHNKGGDFILFSDILWEPPLRTPLVWKYPY